MHTGTPIKAGVIEGFFGQPWNWPARLGGIEYLHELAYRFYIYAPKSDSFLRRRWREPLPMETLHQLSGLRARCKALDIVLGIGLTPFEIHLNYDADARVALHSKVLQINEVGADLLCILFDDMRGDVEGLAEIQSSVISDICAWSNARDFIVCPTYYSYDPLLTRQFGSPTKSYLREFARFVDPRIGIFWTGEKVTSAGYSSQHLMDVANEIGRKPFIWDNHIANDSRTRTNHLFLDPSTSTWELPADLVAGLAINPMNQHYLSRIALCGYRHLLAGASWRQGLIAECLTLVEPSFGNRLLADYGILQNAGLDRLDSITRRRLLDYYGTRTANPYASEIAAWLRGEYCFDPQCLTT